MKIQIERVNHGNYLVDCPGCGTVGVWRDRPSAVEARDSHVCGVTSDVPGKWGARDRLMPGGSITGQSFST